MKKSIILVETALLGRGLPSIDSSQIKEQWPKSDLVKLVWIHNGKLFIDNLEQFLKIRENHWERTGASKLSSTLNSGGSSFLTASALMHIACSKNEKYVVTAGMGGIRQGLVSDDLKCLAELPVMLIASSPKDSQEIDGTIKYLKNNNVTVLGYNTNILDGFLFSSLNIPLEMFNENNLKDILQIKAGCLLLNPIKPNKKIKQNKILEDAVKESIKQGNSKEFHPLVNKYLDEFTNGEASQMQLNALIDNINTAIALLEKAQV